MRARLLLPVVMVVCGCASSPSSPPMAVASRSACPELPYDLVGLEAIAPLAEWGTWYAQAEACASLSGNFGALRWFSVREVRDRADGRLTGVRAISCADDVYLTALDEDLVRHEILHHILDRPGHPEAYFPRCAEGLVGAGR